MKSKFSGWLAGRQVRLALALAMLALLGVFLLGGGPAPAPVESAGAARPALSVSLTRPQLADWPQVLAADGNVVAWQEAVIGAEIDNFRISEVSVQVGQSVRKGQVLARIASDTVASELAEATAAVAELEAMAAEAKGNAARAAELQARGFYSGQLNLQYQTAERTAHARLTAARARQQAAALRLARTSVLAPDDGVISARSATVGSLTQPGQELFRLIRGGRLEWRAELAAAELAQVRAGGEAVLSGPDGAPVRGVVRMVAPSVDAKTRNGLVYVDLPQPGALRAGMFATGEFRLGQRPALTLPQSAVLLREGFAYVFRLAGESRVAQVKVSLGRRIGERVEVVDGLDAQAEVVATGAGFLADGDAVKVVDGISK